MEFPALGFWLAQPYLIQVITGEPVEGSMKEDLSASSHPLLPLSLSFFFSPSAFKQNNKQKFKTILYS